MDQNYITNEQQQITQHQLVQEQQEGSLPLQYHPIQHSGYGITPAQHTTYSAPSLMNFHPSQLNPSVTKDSTRG
jgi:hypothetical protein